MPNNPIQDELHEQFTYKGVVLFETHIMYKLISFFTS